MKNMEVGREFVGTRDQACAVFFEQLALVSKDDSQCEKFYESLAKYYRKKVDNTRKRFKVTISTVN